MTGRENEAKWKVKEGNDNKIKTKGENEGKRERRKEEREEGNIAQATVERNSSMERIKGGWNFWLLQGA